MRFPGLLVLQNCSFAGNCISLFYVSNPAALKLRYVDLFPPLEILAHGVSRGKVVELELEKLESGIVQLMNFAHVIGLIKLIKAVQSKGFGIQWPDSSTPQPFSMPNFKWNDGRMDIGLAALRNFAEAVIAEAGRKPEVRALEHSFVFASVNRIFVTHTQACLILLVTKGDN